MSGSGMQGRNWVLAAMIFAVSMTFIDQTIVSIAVPNIQRELGLTSTGVQWVVNGYLISLAALFALGGRLGDIFGLQQSVPWGWSNPWTWICIIAGLVIIGIFVLVELRTQSPLIKVEIFRIRPFAVENLVLMIAMMAFIPVFFFASEYAQIALRESASGAGIFLLWFFLGFVILAQVGGRMLDREGAKRAVVIGCAIAAVGFGFWASKATTLSFGKQQIWVIVAGAGMGMMLGPANTDAVNRAGNLSYGEATGITQTIRNYGASLGLAALGTILLFNYRSHLTSSLQKMGDPHAVAEANRITQTQQGSGSVSSIPHFVSLDFAHATQSVLYVMCGIMAFAALVALTGLKRGRQELAPVEDTSLASPAESS